MELYIYYVNLKVSEILMFIGTFLQYFISILYLIFNILLMNHFIIVNVHQEVIIMNLLLKF